MPTVASIQSSQCNACSFECDAQQGTPTVAKATSPAAATTYIHAQFQRPSVDGTASHPTSNSATCPCTSLHARVESPWNRLPAGSCAPAVNYLIGSPSHDPAQRCTPPSVGAGHGTHPSLGPTPTCTLPPNSDSQLAYSATCCPAQQEGHKFINLIRTEQAGEQALPCQPPMSSGGPTPPACCVPDLGRELKLGACLPPLCVACAF
jgi:hypothetical protein